MDGMHSSSPIPVIIADEGLDLHEVRRIAQGQALVTFGATARTRMLASENFLSGLAAERRCIYGVTTGFGPLAGYRLEPEFGTQLQRKLVYHLATGVGSPLAPDVARAIMTIRLVTLLRGRSAVSPDVADLLCSCLNNDLVPVIPEKGTVGASGDLTPLAHLALVLMGEGQAWLNGQLMPSDQALSIVGLAPLTLAGRTALALVNGTAAMTAIAVLNAAETSRAMAICCTHAVLFCEVLEGCATAFHEAFGRIRPHAGQIEAHRRLNAIAKGSMRLRPHEDLPAMLPESAADGVHAYTAPHQDPYTLRCAPQILGAVFDVFTFHDGIVTTEINAVTDNPVILADEMSVLHGGNFQGQHVAFAADAQSIAVVKLAEYAERRIARLVDATMNKGLSTFLTGGRPGLDSGLMGAQVTASALVAEMRSRAIPVSLQSIPTNGNNQDTVSMGTIAARRAREQIADLFFILAIEAIALAQAVDLRRAADARSFAPCTTTWAAWVRSHSPFLAEDRPLSSEITAIAQRLQQDDLSNLLDPLRRTEG